MGLGFRKVAANVYSALDLGEEKGKIDVLAWFFEFDCSVDSD